MKEYEEFVMDAAEVAKTGIKPLLDSIIYKLMLPQMVAVQLLGEDNSLVNAADDVKTLRREKTRMVAVDLSEGTDVTDISVADRWENFDVTTTKFGGGEEITEEAIDNADFDVVKEELQGIADAMAIKADSRVWEELLDYTLITAEVIAGGATEFDLAHGDNTVTGEAIYAVTNVTVTNPTTWELDYLNGHIKFAIDPGASTISYYYGSTARGYVRAATAGTVSYNDIINMRTSLRKVLVKGERTVVTDAESEGQLLKDDKFLDASAYGDKVVLNGEIGKISGMRVVTTDTLFDNLPVVLIRGDNLGKVVYKKKLSTKVQQLEKRTDDVWIQAWQKSFPGIVRPTWIRVLINAQIYAYDE